MRTALLALIAGALALSALSGTASATGPCVRTSGGYWEACVDHNGCTAYVWMTMPPYVCL
jgi:hypothetical protein